MIYEWKQEILYLGKTGDKLCSKTKDKACGKTKDKYVVK